MSCKDTDKLQFIKRTLKEILWHSGFHSSGECEWNVP